jgi:predicted DsbA family dithiol-disulfide isomerase
LVEIAEAVGLDGQEARRVIEEREYKEAVDEDWRRSREAGVTGVPTFYGNDLVVVGCQPYETLEKFVLHLMQINSNQNEAG